MSPDVEQLNAEILEETRKLSDAYKERFENDPVGELQAWLHIAARREAMVSQVYGMSERQYRLPEPRLPPGEVAWQAFTLIWQHEVVHTRFIEVRLDEGTLKVKGLAPDLMTWLGRMEGKFLGALTSRPGLRSILSHFAVRLGQLVTPEKLPSFTRDLTELRVRDFFLLCGALETTARQSYARMEELASEALAANPDIDLQLSNLVTEFGRIKLDETFHEQAFREMSEWLAGDDFNRDLTKRECAKRLAALLPRADRGDTGDVENGVNALTDGGLGQLFQDNQLSVFVKAQRAA